jgi:phosphoglycerol transferase MdoB-like AlkP superfamily enzyme
MRATLGSGGAWATCMRLMVIVLTGVVLVWLLDPALQRTFDPGLLWRNALPVVLLSMLIYGLCGRVLLTVGLCSGITWVVFKANAIKVLNMNSPLMPSDAVLGHQVLHNMGFFAHYTGHRLILLVIAALLFFAAIGVLWRVERHWQLPAWISRAVLTLLPLVLIFTMYSGYEPWPRIYRDEALPGFLLYDPMNSVRQVGYMATMVRLSQLPKIYIPAADKSLVARFAQSHADDLKMRMMRKVPLELPDIVVVQSEAFFDPGVLKEVDYGQFVPNFERLAATGITGSLTTPTYGGGTIRTEFETLTGYPMEAFPAVAYPYYGLAAKWMPTVPHRLESLGYSTTLFHPFEADFWNRSKIMPELGFQRSYYLKDFVGVEHEGLYVSDRGLFDFLLEHLDEGANGPKYAMAITMENHGIWDHDPGALVNDLDGKSIPKGLSPQGDEQMKYYLSHLVNGDAALGDFARSLMARPRWTILLFYGDHLPALDHAFKDLGFDNDRTAVEQHTRYMLLSNRPLDPQSPRRLNLSAYQLPGLLFDTAELPEDGYLALASTIRQVWTQDHFQHAAEYGQLQFNAALLEVSCGHKITVTGKCKRQTIPVVATENQLE